MSRPIATPVQVHRRNPHSDTIEVWAGQVVENIPADPGNKVRKIAPTPERCGVIAFSPSGSAERFVIPHESDATPDDPAFFVDLPAWTAKKK